MSIIPASGIDRRLVNEAAKLTATPEDLSRAVNGQLTPAQAYSRVLDVLEQVSQFDAHQQRVLLLIKMSNYLEELNAKGINEKFLPSVTKMFKLLSDQVERASADAGEVSTRLAQAHATYFIEGYMRAMEHGLRALAERTGADVTESDILEIAKESVSISSEYIETMTEGKLD